MPWWKIVLLIYSIMSGLACGGLLLGGYLGYRRNDRINRRTAWHCLAGSSMEGPK